MRLGHPEVVSLGAAPPEAPAPLRRRDGMASTERHGGGRYSTRRTLAGEQAILELTERGRTAGVAMVDADTVARACRAAGLGRDQPVAIARICGAGEQILAGSPLPDAGSEAEHQLAPLAESPGPSL